MAGLNSFNATVSARTSAASQIKSTSDLLQQFTDLGGTVDDLDSIIDAGLEAEAGNHAQGASQSDGKVATAAALRAFAELQREYVALLAVLRAIRGQLLRADADDENAQKLAEIIANRAAVTVTEGAADAEGKKKKVSRASRALEDVRAEIERDSGDVAKFSAVQKRLAERKWTAQRVTKLGAAAKALAGQLGTRTAKGGASKEATLREREAVARQTQAWSASYGILQSLGRRDARVGVLLREASR